jgi:hypothetical protein
LEYEVESAKLTNSWVWYADSPILVTFTFMNNLSCSPRTNS